jgi:hypothetical protein
MNDFGQILGGLMAIAFTFATAVLFAAAIFAAPGFIILSLVGYDGVNFWTSAAAGFGTVFIIALIIAWRG